MKWFKRISLTLVIVISLAFGILYGWSALVIGEKFQSEPRTIELSGDPRVLREGERLAQVFGCYHGCHGADMEGKVFFEEAFVGRFVAPNLTTAIDRYTTSELEALVRQGIRPDGTSLLGMPSEGFSVMTDEDLSAILSFMSSYPRQQHDEGKTQIGPLARLGLVMGEFWVAAAKTRPAPWEAGALEDPLMLGNYLAMNTCSECHGLELEGQKGFTPPLAIAKAYSFEDFDRLMATGIGLGDRDLGLMSAVSKLRFSHMKSNEVQALYDYLYSR